MYYKKKRLSKSKTIDEHRFIMQQHLGRKLEKWEEVHHKDGNKRNNELSNLEILHKREHARLHSIDRVMSQETKEKLRISGIKNRPAAKMTPDDAKIIKHYLATGLRNCEVSRITGFDKMAVSQIKRGKRWAWVQYEGIAGM